MQSVDGQSPSPHAGSGGAHLQEGGGQHVIRATTVCDGEDDRHGVLPAVALLHVEHPFCRDLHHLQRPTRSTTVSQHALRNDPQSLHGAGWAVQRTLASAAMDCASAARCSMSLAVRRVSRGVGLNQHNPTLLQRGCYWTDNIGSAQIYLIPTSEVKGGRDGKIWMDTRCTEGAPTSAAAQLLGSTVTPAAWRLLPGLGDPPAPGDLSPAIGPRLPPVMAAHWPRPAGRVHGVNQRRCFFPCAERAAMVSEPPPQHRHAGCAGGKRPVGAAADSDRECV